MSVKYLTNRNGVVGHLALEYPQGTALLSLRKAASTWTFVLVLPNTV